MVNDKISLKTEAGKSIEVAVIDMSERAIHVAIGEGIHNVKCTLVPTENGKAYFGSVMGREVVYERSVDQVKADLGVGRIERKPVRS